MMNVKCFSMCYVYHMTVVLWSRCYCHKYFGFYGFISTSVYQALCALLCKSEPLMFPDVISVPLRNAFSY